MKNKNRRQRHPIRLYHPLTKVAWVNLYVFVIVLIYILKVYLPYKLGTYDDWTAAGSMMTYVFLASPGLVINVLAIGQAPRVGASNKGPLLGAFVAGAFGIIGGQFGFMLLAAAFLATVLCFSATAEVR